jgi:VanZ family protein
VLALAIGATRTLAVVAVYALLNEYHQIFTRTRSGSVYDSVIDFSGALTAMLLLWWKRRTRRGEQSAEELQRVY